MANDMMLYWGSGSGPCWRVMLVLEEKGLQYKEKLMSFQKKEHKREEILKMNPPGQLPTFKHGDIVINESMAICVYLEEAADGFPPGFVWFFHYDAGRHCTGYTFLLCSHSHRKLQMVFHRASSGSSTMMPAVIVQTTFKGQGTTLIPDTPKEQAFVLQRAFKAQNIQKNCREELVYYIRRAKEEDRKEEEIRKREEIVRKQVQLWENYMGKLL